MDRLTQTYFLLIDGQKHIFLLIYGDKHHFFGIDGQNHYFLLTYEQKYDFFTDRWTETSFSSLITSSHTHTSCFLNRLTIFLKDKYSR